MIHPSDDDAVELLAHRLDDYCRRHDSRLNPLRGSDTKDDDLPTELRERLSRARIVADQLAFLGTADTFDNQVNEPSLVGRQFGRFEVRAVQGVGGFGVVYRAYDPSVEREVALKVPRVESLLSSESRQRFLQEARAVAKLDHPNIAAVMESGEIGGMPIIVSTYCPGDTLAQWMKAHAIEIDSRVAIDVILPLAEAIEHAHGRGVLHRDIKPSNIILVPSEPSNDSSFLFVPKLTDFGLAKLTESSFDQTRTGALLGTVRYMAPEQAAGRVHEISTASDIYSLGMVFYELLTGATAFHAETDVAILSRIQIDDVAPPRKLRPAIPKDIEAICLKCLERSPQDRYRSAGELAEDLRRVRRGEPTLARPLTWSENLLRWARRRPAFAALAIVTLLLAVTAGAGGVWYSYRLSNALAKTEAALSRAELSEQRSEHLLYAADMKLASEALANNDIKQVSQLLERHLPAPGKEDRRNFIWHFLASSIHHDPIETQSTQHTIYSQAMSADQRRIITGDSGGWIGVFGTDPYEQIDSIESGQTEVNGVAVNKDATLFSSAGKDGTVKVWKSGVREPLHTLAACKNGEAFAAAFVRGGELLVTGGQDTAIRFWSVKDGSLVKEIIDERRPQIESISASPDGRRVICFDSNAYIVFIDTTTFKIVEHRHADLIGRGAVALYSPDGSRIAIAGSGRGVAILDANGIQQSYLEISGHRKEALAWNHDASMLFVGDRTGTLHAIDVPKAAPIPSTKSKRGSKTTSAARPPRVVDSWQAHSGRIWSIVYEHKNGRMISTSTAGDLRRWNLHPSSHWQPMSSTNGMRPKLFYQFAGKDKLGIGSDPYGLASIDPKTLEIVRSVDPKFSSDCQATLSSDGESIALVRGEQASGRGAELAILRMADLACTSSLSIPALGGSLNAAFTRDGEYLGAAFRLALNEFHLYDAKSLTLLKKVSFEGRGVCLSTTANVGGEECFLVDDQNDFVALRSRDLSVAWRWQGHLFGISSAVLSPNGYILYSMGGDGLVKSWDLRSRQLQSILSGENADANRMALSPDGTVLVTLSDSSRQLRLWDCRTQQQVMETDLPVHQLTHDCEFAPDGRRLIVTFLGHQMFVLDTR